jgi:hypothetical protein
MASCAAAAAIPAFVLPMPLTRAAKQPVYFALPASPIRD